LAAIGCADSTGDDNSGESLGDTGTETGETPEQAPGLAAEPEIVHHPNQPMVVDVLVTLDRPGLVELVHDDDAGVRIVSLTGLDPADQHHLRVRGLTPASVHALSLTIINPADPSQRADHPVAIATHGVQPGFRPSFEVEVGDPAAIDPSYRMFDYANMPLVDPAGIFVIDPQGITRWYYNGGTPTYVGATAIWAGISLLDDGTVLALHDGAVAIIDELGERRLWLPSADHNLALYHHDVIQLQNGNYLALSNSFERVDYSSIGGDPNRLVAGDLLVELDHTGDIVWTWDSFAELDPLRIRSQQGDGLTYFDPESGEYGFDWTHGNGVIEREDGLLLISLRHQNWLVAIDHATAEVVWRLGDEGDFDLLEGTWFFHQHSPEWQPDGSLLLYDNANGNPDVPLHQLHSRAVRYELDEVAMTARQVWDSRQDPPYLSPVAGDADRTPSGHVLMLDSSLQPDPSIFDLGKNYARIVEIPSEGEPTPLWSLTTKIGSFVYRATTIDRLPGED
jgi:hypothetical protein